MPCPPPRVALFALLALGACHSQPSQSIEREVTISGDPAVLDRFVSAQRGARPTLTFHREGNQARTQLPPAYTGKDIVAVTHAALAAGLNYSVTTHAVTTTPPSTIIRADVQITDNRATQAR